MQPSLQSNTGTSRPSARLNARSLRDNFSLASAAQQREGQLSRKANLLAESTRNFCELDRPSRQEIDMYKELFYQMIKGCGKSERRLLSASLARNVYTPRQILMYLALDTPDIAAPVLLFSPAINEFDIVTLSSRLSLDHLKILCRRMDLSEESAKVLEKAGGAECADLLARNPALVRLKQQDNTHAQNMTSAPAVEVKQSENLELSRSNPAQRNRAQNKIVEIAGRGGKLGRSQQQDPSKFKYDPAHPLEGQLLRAARTGQNRGISELVESYCGIRASIIRRLLSEPGAENLCVLFKGLGTGFVTTLQLLLLLNLEVSTSRTCYDDIKTLVSEIRFDDCRNFLKKLGGKFDQQQTDANISPPQNRLMDAVISRRREISSQSPVQIDQAGGIENLKEAG